LGDRYGRGHYASQAAHVARWRQFAAYAKAKDIKDARALTRNFINEYGKTLMEQVRKGAMAISYAQNLLSTVNVVTETLRGDRTLRISPANLVGTRTHVRQNAPRGLDIDQVQQIVAALKVNNEPRVALVAELARRLGLRFREATLLDAKKALQQADSKGQVNITAGTKGARGKSKDRWVPVTARAKHTLLEAAHLQDDGRNLVPEHLSFKQWRDHAYHVWSQITGPNSVKGFHDFRAAYACDRYQEVTGHAAPCVVGRRIVDKAIDQSARKTIAQELGHGRTDVVAAYVGSTR